MDSEARLASRERFKNVNSEKEFDNRVVEEIHEKCVHEDRGGSVIGDQYGRSYGWASHTGYVSFSEYAIESAFRGDTEDDSSKKRKRDRVKRREKVSLNVIEDNVDENNKEVRSPQNKKKAEKTGTGDRG